MRLVPAPHAPPRSARVRRAPAKNGTEATGRTEVSTQRGRANVVVCSTWLTCKSARETGIYAIGMHNRFVDNRVAGWYNTFFSPGTHQPQGNGLAWGRACPQMTPFLEFRGQVTVSSFVRSSISWSVGRSVGRSLLLAADCSSFIRSFIRF